MRILYVLPFVPWSVRVRSFNLIPRLARHHEIHLVCLAESRRALTRIEALKEICKTVRVAESSFPRSILRSAFALPTPTPLRLAYFASPKMNTAVREAVESVKPDVVYVERWRALQYLPQDLKIPVVCDPTDSMILYNRRLISAGAWWQKPIGLEEYLKFQRAEPRLGRRVNATVFCSRVDMECLLERDRKIRCELIPNGVDCQKFFMKGELTENAVPRIIFTGAFGYRPNRQAVTYFLQEIFPQVQKAVPNVECYIVGNEATKRLSGFRRPGLHITDFVPDLHAELARATVSVAPITVGSGVSNKVLEAFATGTPIVATSIACGDLPVRNGEQLLIANDAKGFAEGIISLLGSAEKRQRLTASARRLVVDQYDWEIIYRKMEELLSSVSMLPSRVMTG